MFASLRQFIKDRSGITAVECALIAALVAVAAVTVVSTVSSSPPPPAAHVAFTHR
jgi:Flp pilus assembly pilin Flp